MPVSHTVVTLVSAASWIGTLMAIGSRFLAKRLGGGGGPLPASWWRPSRTPWWILVLGASVALPAVVQWRVGPLTALSNLLLRRLKIVHTPNPSPRRQRGQRPAAYPPPYPNGWYRVLSSSDLPVKGVTPLRVCGHDLVAFRTEQGQVVVLDAYCPHLGAHLGAGGTVKGECVRCPFHGWEFDATGQCVGVPGCPPKGAGGAGSTGSGNAAYKTSIRAWHAVEYWDSVYLYHDSENPSGEPTWWPNDPTLPPPPRALVPKSLLPEEEDEVDRATTTTKRDKGLHGSSSSGDGQTIAATTPVAMTPALLEYFDPKQYFLAGSTHAIVNTHIQEVPENGADVAHLNVLHTDFVVKALRWIIHHDWTATWASAMTNREDPAAKHLPPHISTIYLTQRMRDNACSNNLPSSFVPAYINQIGPGVVRLRLVIAGRFECVVHEYITPIAPTVCQATHTVHARHGTPRFLAQLVLWALDTQFQRDVPIWEAKKFEPKPILSPMDGPMPSYRRWYGQFYGPSSVSFSDAVLKEQMLDDW